MEFENFNFTDLIETLDSMGFYDVALPFLLVFTIFFAILSKLSLFGEKKNINVVIALVFAFLFVRVSSIVELTNEFFPKVSMVAIVLISLLVLIGIFGVNLELKGMPMGVAFFIALSLLSAFNLAASNNINPSDNGLNKLSLKNL